MNPSFLRELKRSRIPGAGAAGAIGITALLFLLVVWVQRETEIQPPEPDPVITPFAIPPPPPPPQMGESKSQKFEEISFDIPILKASQEIGLDFLDLDFEVGPSATIEVDLDVDSYARKSLKESFEVPAVFENREVDRKPNPIYTWTPSTPRELRDKRTQVHVIYIVNTKGRAERIFVMDSTDEVLIDFVTESIQRWRFEPARKQGKRVSVWVEQAFIISDRRSSNPFSL